MMAAILLAGFTLNYPHEPERKTNRFPPWYKGEYCHLIHDAADTFGVDPRLIRAVIRAESGFRRDAISRVGAKGLMQIMPATATRFRVRNSYEPRQSIFGGAMYLRWLLDEFDGNVSIALAGYNAGENAVRRYGGVPPYRETVNYVRKISRRLD